MPPYPSSSNRQSPGAAHIVVNQLQNLGEIPGVCVCVRVCVCVCGLSIFSGVDAGLDCGSGLGDGTQRKLRSSNFEAAHTLIHYNILTSHEQNSGQTAITRNQYT